mgnify:CR=1 FL=1
MGFKKLNFFTTNGSEGVENVENNADLSVVDTPNNGNKMILLEPRAYSESQQIADYLKRGSSVVVNLKRVTPDQAKRIVDFLSGTIYAIEGDLQKLGGGIFLCTPHGVDVEGKISDEGNKNNTNGANKNTNGKKEDNEEDEFNF